MTNTSLYQNALLKRLSSATKRTVSLWRVQYLLTSILLDNHTEFRTRHSQDILNATKLSGIAKRLVQAMCRQGVIRPFQQTTNLYEVTAPYSERVPLDEREIALELNPYASISHLSAFAHWGITYQTPKMTRLTAPRSAHKSGVRPAGVEPGDETGLTPPPAKTPERADGYRFEWVTVKDELYFGFEERGWLRVMTLERSLLDGLREPAFCGGITEVLRAFRTSRETLNLPRLIEYVQAFNIAVLRQRAGFVLTRLGFKHPEISRWQRTAKRGGSSRLVASEPFAPTFDADWSLSINCSLQGLEEEA
jgi:predicted transcriptional regulator of viral defense system